MASAPATTTAATSPEVRRPAADMLAPPAIRSEGGAHIGAPPLARREAPPGARLPAELGLPQAPELGIVGCVAGDPAVALHVGKRREHRRAEDDFGLGDLALLAAGAPVVAELLHQEIQQRR